MQFQGKTGGGNYLGGFKHDLSRVVEKSQGSFGEATRPHQDCREFHIGIPWIHHLLCAEALEMYENQIYKALYKGEVPTIAEKTKNPILIERSQIETTKAKKIKQISLFKSSVKNLNCRRLYTYS